MQHEMITPDPRKWTRVLRQVQPENTRRARRRAGRLLRGLARAWAGPGSLVGLVLAVLARASGGVTRRHEGTLEVHGGVLRRLMSFPGGRAVGLRAITLGHVILARDAASLEEFRLHERTHVRQWERWGPLFPIAYLIASCGAWVRGEDPYRGNRFEREAWGDPPDRAK